MAKRCNCYALASALRLCESTINGELGGLGEDELRDSFQSHVDARDAARKALSAYDHSAQPIAPPREPTEAMIQAAIDEDLKRAKTHQPVTDYGGLWRSMYDAAVKP